MSRERELLEKVVENFAYVQDMHLIVAIQKLLNQPERGPLSDRQIKILYGRDASDMDNQEYIWGFRDAEKHHGIGGGE
jgi:hypothetical protein